MKRMTALLCICLLALCGCESSSDDTQNVLIVVNTNHPDSLQLGKYYAGKRSIHWKYICKIECPVDEVVKQEDYENLIRAPIRDHLTRNELRNSIDYIVLTRGIPIRTHTHWGVDSALTSLWLDGGNRMTNPYYRVDRAFASKEFGMYLVTRLDGLSLSDAKALVDRSVAAKPEKGLFLLDVSPGYDGSPGYKFVNDAMRKAAELLKGKGYEVELEETPDFAVREGIMGYYSWGFHEKKYTTKAYNQLRFVPGSLAETAVSTSAFTLTADRKLEGDRSYITDLVAQGATGVKGYVYEPYTYALADAEILFDRYTSGRNLAESYYAASRFLHWRDIILGDPLCSPYAKSD